MNSAYRLLRALLIVLWPPAVFAASTVTLDVTLGEIHYNVWIIVTVLATMGGLTSLLHRLRTEVPSALVVYVASHMLMAWFAGIGGFFLLEASQTPDLVEVPLIGVCSYMGARLVDAATESFAAWFDKRMTNIFGGEK